MRRRLLGGSIVGVVVATVAFSSRSFIVMRDIESLKSRESECMMSGTIILIADAYSPSSGGFWRLFVVFAASFWCKGKGKRLKRIFYRGFATQWFFTKGKINRDNSYVKGVFAVSLRFVLSALCLHINYHN
jgi:hypothetical protein